jgi:polar amino acid transport system substrate-binding protein
VVQGKADAFIYDQLTIYRNWGIHKDTTVAVFIPFQDVEQWGVAVKRATGSS